MAGTICSTAKGYLKAMSALVDRVDDRAIDRFAELIYQAWRDGRRVYVFGNGGSAATASHFVADFVKTAAVDGQKRLQAFGLSDNMGVLTAVGNDIEYEDIFCYPLSTYAQRGDLAVAITGSGNSPNVLRACRWAKENGVSVIGLTGFSGGKLGGVADLHINIPSDNYGIIEDLHLSIGHIVAQSLKSRILAEVEGKRC